MFVKLLVLKMVWIALRGVSVNFFLLILFEENSTANHSLFCLFGLFGIKFTIVCLFRGIRSETNWFPQNIWFLGAFGFFFYLYSILSAVKSHSRSSNVWFLWAQCQLFCYLSFTVHPVAGVPFTHVSRAAVSPCFAPKQPLKEPQCQKSSHVMRVWWLFSESRSVVGTRINRSSSRNSRREGSNQQQGATHNRKPQKATIPCILGGLGSNQRVLRTWFVVPLETCLFQGVCNFDGLFLCYVLFFGNFSHCFEKWIWDEKNCLLKHEAWGTFCQWFLLFHHFLRAKSSCNPSTVATIQNESKSKPIIHMKQCRDT